jgi:hypothetical protein
MPHICHCHATALVELYLALVQGTLQSSLIVLSRDGHFGFRVVAAETDSRPCNVVEMPAPLTLGNSSQP